MEEELVPIQENDYKDLLLQTVAVIEHACVKVARHIAATSKYNYVFCIFIYINSVLR